MVLLSGRSHGVCGNRGQVDAPNGAARYFHGGELADPELSGEVANLAVEFDGRLMLGATGASSFDDLMDRAIEVDVPSEAGRYCVEDMTLAANIGLALQRDPSCLFAIQSIKSLYHKYKINQVFLNFRIRTYFREGAIKTIKLRGVRIKLAGDYPLSCLMYFSSNGFDSTFGWFGLADNSRAQKIKPD